MAFTAPPPLRSLFHPRPSSTRRARPPFPAIAPSRVLRVSHLSRPTDRRSLQHVSVTAMTATASPSASFYRIGTPGVIWGPAERSAWKAQTSRQRSYADEVLAKLDGLKSDFEVLQYGALSHGEYPLYALKSRLWTPGLPCVLVTGGIHGYETSGVQGALQFCGTSAAAFAGRVNLLVAPCVSPWAYEHIQRWNADILDPNRSFKGAGTTEESAALIAFLETMGVERWACHVDLHETTDTDESEFMPAKAAEAGKMRYVPDPIPDGFYLVSDAARPAMDWQEAIREAVREVTHIAPPDASGRIIGVGIAGEGIIQIPAAQVGLCMGVTNAEFATTTEVYPDSPKASDEICNAAQVAAVVGALDAMLSSKQ